MNIIDAIKSGKPFRRSGTAFWLIKEDILNHSNEDVLADDWEIEESIVTFTKTQFYNAIADVMQDLAIKENFGFLTVRGIKTRPVDIGSFNGWKELAKKLGF